MQTVKLFTTGRSQALRIPKEFRFQSSEVCIKRIGSMVILIDPNDRPKMFLSAIGQITEDFMPDRLRTRVGNKITR